MLNHPRCDTDAVLHAPVFYPVYFFRDPLIDPGQPTLISRNDIRLSHTAWTMTDVRAFRLVCDSRWRCGCLMRMWVPSTAPIEASSKVTKFVFHSYSFNKEFDMSQTITIRKHAKYKHDSSRWCRRANIFLHQSSQYSTHLHMHICHIS